MDSELVTEPPPWSPWRPQAPPPAASTVVGPRPSIVAAIKVFHTLAWASIEACVLYVLYTGLAGRTDKRVGFAGGVVLGEILIFVGNRFRCPLTALAERYGAKHGSVTDIYLPTWFAHNLPAIHTPLLVLMAYLHARNLRRQRGLSANVGLDSPRSGTARPVSHQPAAAGFRA